MGNPAQMAMAALQKSQMMRARAQNQQAWQQNKNPLANYQQYRAKQIEIQKYRQKHAQACAEATAQARQFQAMRSQNPRMNMAHGRTTSAQDVRNTIAMAHQK